MEKPKNTKSLRWNILRRMEFIEFRLLWEGGINRADLMDQFGVSAPQASNDLTLYKATAAQNLNYDLSEKRYFETPEFKPQFLKPDTDRYLSQLKLIADNVVSSQETWLSLIPSVDSVPVPNRHVDINILKQLVSAIRSNRSLKVRYMSPSSSKAKDDWRCITPHAFAHDSMRWHIRSFCHNELKFKDFILSRFLEIGASGPPGARASDDKNWNETIDVILMPNPLLPKAYRDIILLDYGMTDGELSIPVRKAILLYFKKRLRLDVAEALEDPKEAPVVIKNAKEFESALKETGLG